MVSITPIIHSHQIRLRPPVVMLNLAQVSFQSTPMNTPCTFMDDIKVNNHLAINAGVRYSHIFPVGTYTSKLDGTQYGTFKPAITYTGLEPRLNFKYKTGETSSVKGGITFTNQYLHLVSNSSSTLPTDIWVPSTEIVKPQRGIQMLWVFQKF